MKKLFLLFTFLTSSLVAQEGFVMFNMNKIEFQNTGKAFATEWNCSVKSNGEASGCSYTFPYPDPKGYDHGLIKGTLSKSVVLWDTAFCMLCAEHKFLDKPKKIV